MDNVLARRFFVTALVALTVSLGVSAQPRAPQPALAQEGPPIRLRAGTFTPARGEQLIVPDSLRLREVEPGRRHYFIVQFAGPVQDAWKGEVESAGGEVLAYIPEWALKVRMHPAQAAEVARQANVIWVGAVHPAYKLPPDILRDAQVRPYKVRVERGTNGNAIAGAVAATGATVLQRDGAVFTIAANAEQLEAVARVLDVSAIETFTLRRKHNEFGGSIMRAEMASAAGYDGSTQTIGITDTGLGGGNAALAHEGVSPDRIAAIFNWPGAQNFCFETVANDGAVDVDTGHGTHVATSALGAGAADGTGRGTAPASRLVFQAIEDFVIPSFFCQLLLGLPPGYYLAGIPADVGELFEQSYGAGARVHSNSWGSAVNGAYTDDSASTDAFVWANPDFAMTISAGNSGIDANGDGIVDPGSLNAPGTAKNVITVGASEGDRAGSYACDPVSSACPPGNTQNEIFSYGAAFGGAFSANPLKDDPTAGNAQQMAAFSSRGPTTDGRIKPDVVAPGTWILSGYSDQYQAHYDSSPNPQTGLYQYDGWGEPLNSKYKYMGGTSMSAPLVAGAAAVVRDYYEKAHSHSASAALVKATLVNSAVDLLDENNDGVDDNASAIPNVHEGWGRVDLGAATDGTRTFFDAEPALLTAESWSHTITIDDSQFPLRVTLAWTDAPSTPTAAISLVNDLDLHVSGPDGTTYLGNVFLDGWSSPTGASDRLNNLENVYVMVPTAGQWTITVRAHNVPMGPQPFAVVVGRGSAPVPQLPRVDVVALDANASEAGPDPGAVRFTRSGDLSNELSVGYTVAGTAVPGEDYTPLPGTVIFAAGSAHATVLVEPLDDALVEAAETITITAIAGPGYGVRAPVTASVTVASDDLPGDLHVSALTVPSTAVAGGAIVVTETTTNRGAHATQASQTALYLSANASLDAGDTLLGSRDVPALSPGAAHTHTMSVTTPGGLSGSMYVIAKADWNNAVIESNESNNTRPSALVKFGPDLVVPSLSSPGYAAAGGSFTVIETTRNDGADVAPASVTSFFLSTNSALDETDAALGSRSVPVLTAGSSSEASVVLTVPPSVATGTYYVIARADSGGLVSESTETNNTRAAGNLRIGADLLVTSVTGSAMAAPGGPLTVTDTTRNQGGADAAGFVTAMYLSVNSTFGAGDIRLGARTVALLGAGHDTTATFTVSVPSSTTPGEYYLVAYADDLQSVVEPLETNNSRTATARVKVGPDLTITVSAPVLAGAGSPVSVTDSIRNLAAATSNPTEAAFYLSANTTLDASDMEIGRRSVAAIGPGATDARTTVLTLPNDVAVGSHYIIAVADPDNVVAEALENNNSGRSSLVRIGPDLTLTTLTSATSITAGTTVNVTDTAKNTGGGSAAASTTTYYLSLNTVIDAGDVILGTRAVPALAANASDSATTVLLVTANTSPGTYYLIASVDDGDAVAETTESNNTRRLTVKVSAP
jgi:subtilase family serine protease/subtilisin family serine protease